MNEAWQKSRKRRARKEENSAQLLAKADEGAAKLI